MALVCAVVRVEAAAAVASWVNSEALGVLDAIAAALSKSWLAGGSAVAVVATPGRLSGSLGGGAQSPRPQLMLGRRMPGTTAALSGRLGVAADAVTARTGPTAGEGK